LLHSFLVIIDLGEAELPRQEAREEQVACSAEIEVL
jgi:hypothetical protein